MVTSVNKQMIIPEELCEAPFPEANDQMYRVNCDDTLRAIRDWI